MAGASADGEVNHWPAFVDVLTTVIMVVTFLLVIMSAAVMTLSQRAMEQFKERFTAEQKHKADKDGESASATHAPRIGKNGEPILSPRDAEAGSSISQLGSVLRSESVPNGVERLSIRTRETPDMLKLQVKATEEADNTKGVEVKVADVLMQVSFEPNAVTYDADNTNKVVAFLKSKAQSGLKYEIWSFAPQTASVSEAQRLAFYRAATTRNILIRAGISPADILTQVRVTDALSKDGHMVRVVLKP